MLQTEVEFVLPCGYADGEGTLHHVGVTSSFTMERRRELVAELAPLREGALDHHPWKEWKEMEAEEPAQRPLRLDLGLENPQPGDSEGLRDRADVGGGLGAHPLSETRARPESWPLCDERTGRQSAVPRSWSVVEARPGTGD